MSKLRLLYLVTFLVCFFAFIQSSSIKNNQCQGVITEYFNDAARDSVSTIEVIK